MAPSPDVRPRRCSALGADTLNVMGSDPPVWISTSPEFKYQSNTSATPSFEVGDVAVERHGHDRDNLRHCVLLRGMEAAFRGSHGYYERAKGSARLRTECQRM